MPQLPGSTHPHPPPLDNPRLSAPSVPFLRVLQQVEPQAPTGVPCSTIFSALEASPDPHLLGSLSHTPTRVFWDHLPNKLLDFELFSWGSASRGTQPKAFAIN